MVICQNIDDWMKVLKLWKFGLCRNAWGTDFTFYFGIQSNFIVRNNLGPEVSHRTEVLTYLYLPLSRPVFASEEVTYTTTSTLWSFNKLMQESGVWNLAHIQHHFCTWAYWKSKRHPVVEGGPGKLHLTRWCSSPTQGRCSPAAGAATTTTGQQRGSEWPTLKSGRVEGIRTWPKRWVLHLRRGHLYCFALRCLVGKRRISTTTSNANAATTTSRPTLRRAAL